MPGYAVIGAQWGDEGKGKIVDWLAEGARAVVRFQGGNNAGHTITVGAREFKLSLLPASVLRPDKLALIGGGVVLDPAALLAELDGLAAMGIEVPAARLRLAETAPLILSLHRRLDSLREAARGARRIGTTGRGIGPAYEDKIGRRAVRLADLFEPDALDARLAALVAHHAPAFEAAGEVPPDPAALAAELAEPARRLEAHAAPVWRELAALQAAGETVIFEGAQGVMLDIDHGTYPYVTSSNTVAANAATGSGQGPGALAGVLGVAKAYCTRVGAGPFPSEDEGPDGARLAEAGREVGTVTGRARRCGWLDMAALRQAIAVGGITELAVTKLDVLDGFEEIWLCTGYELDGARLDHMPAGAAAQARLTPIYETLPGWGAARTAGLRDLGSLPPAARALIDRIEAQAGCPVALVATGPERDDIIRCRPLVTDR